jgi:radical SAM protein with 4Fe4S-binding SPASM domain
MADNPYISKLPMDSSRLWPGKGPRIIQLDVELTERCNNDCLHCSINLPEGDRKARKRELGAEAWKEIFGQVADLGALTIRMTGGEPLLREDFEELYLTVRRLGMKVLLFTNARLITPRIADLLAKVPPLEKIEVTVYGLSPESYEAVTRRKGSFAEFRQGVGLLLDRRIPFAIKGAFLPSNRQEVEALDHWAKAIPGMDGPPSITAVFDLRGRRDSAAKNRAIRKLRPAPAEVLAVLSRTGQAYREGMAEFCRKYMESGKGRLFLCGAGREGSVDAYGIYQPCLLLRDPRLGFDLKKGGLREALTLFFPKVRKIKVANPEFLKRCGRCRLRGLCEQCPGRSWSEHGTLDTPVEYLCEVAHAQARDLGVLKDGEMGWERR